MPMLKVHGLRNYNNYQKKFSSIAKLNFKLMQYHLFIPKVNSGTAYDLQFGHFLFDYHHKVQKHSESYYASTPQAFELYLHNGEKQNLII